MVEAQMKGVDVKGVPFSPLKCRSRKIQNPEKHSLDVRIINAEAQHFVRIEEITTIK